MQSITAGKITRTLILTVRLYDLLDERGNESCSRASPRRDVRIIFKRRKWVISAHSIHSIVLIWKFLIWPFPVIRTNKFKSPRFRATDCYCQQFLCHDEVMSDKIMLCSDQITAVTTRLFFVLKLFLLLNQLSENNRKISLLPQLISEIIYKFVNCLLYYWNCCKF